MFLLLEGTWMKQLWCDTEEAMALCGPLLAQTDHEPVPQGRVLWLVSSQNSPGFEKKE